MNGKLLKKLRGATVTNHATVPVHNLTNTEIPPQVKKSLNWAWKP